MTFAAVQIGTLVESAVSFLFLSLFMMRAIVAITADEEERVIAIGYIVPAAIYGLTLWAVRESEFEFGGNYLITSTALSQMFYAITAGTRDTYWQAQSMAAGHGLISLYLGCAGSEFARSVLRSSSRNKQTRTHNPVDRNGDAVTTL